MKVQSEAKSDLAADQHTSDRRGCIAVVTGASRGIGRGIAEVLGSHGATVFVTGRTKAGDAQPEQLAGTIHSTAKAVTAAGGRGRAVRCDHTVDADVERLAATIEAEAGRVDLLVNNVWGGYEHYDPAVWSKPVWEQPLWRWDKMFATGVRAHYTTTRALLPLLMQGTRPLIVTISAGDQGKYLGDVQYDVAKAADDRLGFALAQALRPEGIVALTVHPGFTRTERVEQVATAEMLAETHSAVFVGRGVWALYQDPEVVAQTGSVFKAGELGLTYGFTDIDGSQPEPFIIPDQT